MALIFSGFVSALLPEGAVRKPLKLLLSTAVAVSVIWSFKGISLTFEDLDTSNNASISSSLASVKEQYECYAAGSAVKRLISERLSASGVSDAEISVITDIDTNGDIYISRINIECELGELEKCREALNALSLKGEVTEK